MGPMGNLDSVHLPKSLNSSCKCIILAKGLSSIIIELCSAGIHTYLLGSRFVFISTTYISMYVLMVPHGSVGCVDL